MLTQLIQHLIKRRIKRIKGFMYHPHETQERLFNHLITTASTTAWGRRFGYREIKTYQQFKERIPISTYEQLFPYIKRQLYGEQNVLWPTKISNFAKSSGTTNARSKYIPISKESLNGGHFKAGIDMIAIYLNRYPKSSFLKGKNISVGGSLQKNPDMPAITCGDISAVIMKNLPFWAEYLRVPKLKVSLMAQWEEKIRKMAQITSKQNITGMSGVPTWIIVLLRHTLEITGKQNILEVWPNIEVFSHGAVAFGPYRQIFRQLIPKDDFHYMEIYNASEGFFAIQDTDAADEMLLLLDHGVYYEFIPLENADDENPPVCPLAQVQIGKNYALLISTNGGLWRYKIGDTIRFTSLEPYRIKISGRTKHFINAFGEEVIIENANTAVSAACQQTDAVITDFTVAPIYLETNKKGGHEWIIEFEKLPKSVAQFTEIVDSKLREVNSDYDAKRYQNMALVMPKIHDVPKGTFYLWMKNRNKLGGQYKVPRLSNNREYVDSILNMLAHRSS